MIGGGGTALNKDYMIAVDELHSLFRGHDRGVFVGDRVKGLGGIIPNRPTLSAGDIAASPFKDSAPEGSHGALLTRSKLSFYSVRKKGTECGKNEHQILIHT